MSSKSERFALLVGIKRAYEDDIGEKLDLVSRVHDNVEHRVALSNAMRPYAIQTDIARVFDKHHATITHYIKEHQPMMEYYPEYVVKYLNALRIAENMAEVTGILPRYSTTDSSIQEQLEIYRTAIVELQRRAKKLETLFAKQEFAD